MTEGGMKNTIRNYRNSDIKRIIMGIPGKDHRHLRTAIETSKGEVIVLQEASVAAIVRAYVNIKSHPVKRGCLLTGRPLENRKKGYAPWQLIEECESDEKVEKLLEELLEKDE